MPFLSGIIVVVPRQIVNQCAAQTKAFVRFVDETEFIHPEEPEKYGLPGFEHASFNFILRSSIICSTKGQELLGRDFLVMDDDNIPLEKIKLDQFMSSNNTYTGYYYQRLSRILPEKFQFRSYDVSLQVTRQMLADRGITDGLVFSSHMPQVINQKIFIEACNFFNPIRYNYMICDWTMYFNYALKHYPQCFCCRPAPVICWPMNPGMAATSLLAKNPIFENYYPENYATGGMFHTLHRYASSDNDWLSQNQEKIAIFRQQFPRHNRFRASLRHMILRVCNAVLPGKLIKISHVLLKENRERPGLLKKAAISCKAIHAGSYIQAMRSRRWIHRGDTIQVVGLYDYPSGLGTSAGYLSETIKEAGNRQVRQVNVSAYFRYPGIRARQHDRIASQDGGTVIFMLGPPQARQVLQAQDFTHIQHKKLINYVWFESNILPADWLSSFNYFDEIWVNNQYIKKLLNPACEQFGIPVHIRPFIPKFARPTDMSQFFTPDKVSILTIFNINSGWYRKNPQALIQAYEMLPGHIARQAELIIKTNSPPGHRHYKKLTALARQYGFTVLNMHCNDQELSGLIQGCDIYASLHRAEGLGLLPMQAMSYGKAVLATGWSGNMSYMSGKDTALVDYELQQGNGQLKKHIADMVIADKLIFTEQGVYAEPDRRQAYRILADLIYNNDLRKQYGINATAKINRYVSDIQKLWRDLER